MKKDFLTQLNEKVKEARSKADNPNQTRKLIEKAKEYCIKNNITLYDYVYDQPWLDR